MDDINPLSVCVLYATDSDEKYIKIGQDGSLAIFDDEQSAKAVKLSHPKTDYKQVNYYSENQVKKLYHQLEQAQARVVELEAAASERCDAPVGWIPPEKYNSAIESKMGFFKTIKELRARVSDYEALTDELDATTRRCYLSGPTVVNQFKRLRQQADEIEKAGGEK